MVLFDVKYNLCTYFLLPLVRLNFKSFSLFDVIADENFKQCYVNRYQPYLYVDVVNPELIDPGAIKSEYYDGIRDYFIRYKVPEKYYVALDLFHEGKYGDFPDAVKGMIRRYSGLMFNQFDVESGFYVTDPLLLAMDRSPEIKIQLEAALGVKLPKDADLISVPSDSNYVYFNEDTEQISSKTLGRLC